ncbi:MAG: DUF3570 domain-containing protein [Steroidobacteraceae bacterium]
MQLKNKQPQRIGASLAAAACSLLGTVPGAVQAVEVVDKDWVVDSAVLFYGEDQGRVQDLSVRAAVTRNINEDRKWDISLSIDTLTGASPSGAVKTDGVQTFTRPSGKGSYQIAAGEQPLDDTFHDTRIAVAGSYTIAVGNASRLQGGLDVSSEYDYLHAGLNLRWETDFNLKNTTWFAGVAVGSDRITAEGDLPIVFSAMRPANVAANRSGSQETKTIVDALVGVSQILSRRALLNVVLGVSNSSGYLTDPFKILSVVDATTGRPVASPYDVGFSYYRYEKRPDSRTKESLFAEYRYALDRDSWAMNYRFMTDDWGISSHTLEAHYHWNLGSHSSLEPQVRYYTQSQADFYKTLLVNGQVLPEFASSDYRLAKMNSWTVGAKYAWQGNSGREYSVRAAYYNQRADASAGSNIGVLNNYSELVPSLSAVVAQFGMKFGF